MVYGLEGYASESDMIVNSSNNTVFDYAATTEGKTSVVYSSLTEAVSYAMTMRLINQADFYGMKMMVRAYAKLNGGSIIYSDCKSTSVYAVAEYLYNNGKMGTKAAHTYLYDNILAVVNPNQAVVDYDWTSSVVKPGDVTTEAPVTEASTTQAPTTEVSTTEAPTTTTTEAPTTTVPENIDTSLDTPFGLVISCPADNTIGVVWGAGEINSYNIYIDGNLVAKDVVAAYYEYYGYVAGTHTVTITTSSNGKESNGTSADVVVTGSSSAKPSTTTVASGGGSQQETTNENTDTSLAIPFGMVVSNPSDNTVGVVWERDINSYNVYIDGTLVASNVSAAYYEFYGYLKGTHTVSIATSNGKESQRLTMSAELKVLLM